MNSRSTLRLLPVVLTSLLLVGLGYAWALRPAPGDVDSYHERVKAAVTAIPSVIGAWESREIPVPPAAQELLKPNALFSRQYMHRTTGRTATLLVIHCRAARDLSGHYPPVCYPAHGWTEAGASDVQMVEVEGLRIPYRRYAFERRKFEGDMELTAYCFFAVPQRGLSARMEDVYSAAANVALRGMGAAQVQFVMGPGMTEEDEREVLRELVAPVLPVLRAVEPGPGERP